MPAVEETLRKILAGRLPEAEIISFLTTLRDRGETVEDLISAVRVMRESMTSVGWTMPEAVDTCGTGGDGKGAFNVSTTAAFVVAGAGIKVAKHGNRSISSQCGSADLLEALGVKIDLPPEVVKQCVEDTGIGFFFAPRYYPATKNAAAARKKIGTRTIFNLLGPLLNPAHVRHQVIGVYDRKWLEPMATVLREFGAEHAFVVHGDDGLDELTTTGASFVTELKGGSIRSFTVQPEELGLSLSTLTDLQGGDSVKNATLLKGILEGYEGPMRDVVLLNAAAALVVADRATNLEEGIHLAGQSIDHGEALARLKKLIEVSNR